MVITSPYRRLPLRDLITDAEKRSRDVSDNLNNNLLTLLSDLRDLSRPIRKKSHYPTLLALRNSLNKAVEMTEETEALIEYLERQLTEIGEHARRERFSRNY